MATTLQHPICSGFQEMWRRCGLLSQLPRVSQACYMTAVSNVTSRSYSMLSIVRGNGLIISDVLTAAASKSQLFALARQAAESQAVPTG